MNKISVLWLIACIALCSLAWWFWDLQRSETRARWESQERDMEIVVDSGELSLSQETRGSDSAFQNQHTLEEESGQENKKDPEAVRTLPFLAQAPDGQWEKDLYQNACEEASLLMVAGFFQGEIYDTDEGKRAIQHVAKWQKETIGTSVDTSAADTLRTLREYFQLQGSLVEQVSIQEMQELLRENLLLLPTNGQKLKNPHFTQPGPETHMLVVHGYDEAHKKFLVHDPGTKFGEGYQYTSEVLLDALANYPTGNHVPRTENEKTLIVIPRDQ